MKNFLKISLFSLFIFVYSAVSWPQDSTVNIDGSKYYESRASHFIVYYDMSVPSDYAAKIADKADIFYSRITEEFSFTRDDLWVWDNRAKIFIAANKDEYNKRFKCAQWSLACVDYYGKTIYTYLGQDGFEATLAHEMCHIIFREYLKIQDFPLWFDEGVAQYIQEKYADVSVVDGLISFVREAVKSKKYIPFSEFMSITSDELQKKDQEYVKNFYIQAFSMIDFLIKKYGRDTFSYFLFTLRSGGGFDNALYKSISQLETQEGFEQKWVSYYME